MAAAAAMNAWMRELWMHGCCCYECMDMWICELWMRGYVSYECVSYGYVRVNVVAMDAWKHGSMEA